VKPKFKEVKKKILAEEGGEIEKETKEKEEIEVEAVEFPREFKSTIVKMINGTFNIIAKRKGDHWKLQSEELEALSNSYIALAEKYTPAIVGRFAIEINAMVWTATIILARIF